MKKIIFISLTAFILLALTVGTFTAQVNNESSDLTDQTVITEESNVINSALNMEATLNNDFERRQFANSGATIEGENFESPGEMEAVVANNDLESTDYTGENRTALEQNLFKKDVNNTAIQSLNLNSLTSRFVTALYDRDDATTTDVYDWNNVEIDTDDTMINTYNTMMDDKAYPMLSSNNSSTNLAIINREGTLTESNTIIHNFDNVMLNSFNDAMVNSYVYSFSNVEGVSVMKHPCSVVAMNSSLEDSDTKIDVAAPGEKNSQVSDFSLKMVESNNVITG